MNLTKILLKVSNTKQNIAYTDATFLSIRELSHKIALTRRHFAPGKFGHRICFRFVHLQLADNLLGSSGEWEHNNNNWPLTQLLFIGT